ncbi:MULTISPECIES: hypothetical protein [Sphingomonas]|uniref:Lectin-like protein BA14k n=1 Tax=Sphingomonas lycopersici TaxID=2951807 RepID=A0AA41ZAW8_9SPHN|nr:MULTISPECIES: hypothetical protein [Sphingomonas]MCW6530505.1 hypothetical protein [Sphingomonas lycopersici]MCW6537195.1 hypothetical protein [Sphingomonas lycopersici]OJU19384.1 MAG: hypothetical protein BGN95_13360 [Sphingomonas sp. 66-10]
MSGFLKKAGLGVALAATALTVAAPADAQRWGGYRHYHRGGDAAGAALVGGILGLGIGAAIASSDRPRYYYYDAPPPPPPSYYYYERPYYPRCYTSWRWDPYWGREEPVRVCR